MKWAYVKINEIESLPSPTSLSPTRFARIDRIKNEDAKKASLAGEWLATRLSGGVICAHPSGQPYIEGSDMHISISHSGEYAVCALSENPVGIDIEKIREVSERLIDRVCTAREREYVTSNERFFEVWTAKEAYFKKIGTGITNLRSVETLDLKREYHKIDDYIICIV